MELDICTSSRPQRQGLGGAWGLKMPFQCRASLREEGYGGVRVGRTGWCIDYRAPEGSFNGTWPSEKLTSKKYYYNVIGFTSDFS